MSQPHKWTFVVLNDFESAPARMSHVTNTNESCSIYEQVVPQPHKRTFVVHNDFESAQIGFLAMQFFVFDSECVHLYHTYECVMSPIWMCLSVRREIHVMSHDQTNYVSRHIYKWVMSHIHMSHVTCINQSCYAYEWTMSPIWTCPSMQRETHTPYVTHINESWVTSGKKKCPKYERVHLCSEKYIHLMSHI